MFRSPFEFPNVQKFLPPPKSSKKKGHLSWNNNTWNLFLGLFNQQQPTVTFAQQPGAPRAPPLILIIGSIRTFSEKRGIRLPSPRRFPSNIEQKHRKKNAKLCCEGVFAIVECLQKNMAATLMHAWRTSRGRSVCSCPLVHAKPLSFPATKPAWHGACWYVLFSVKKEMAKCYHYAIMLCLFTRRVGAFDPRT